MTEVVSIDSEKVTEMLSVTEILLWLSVVEEIEETVGAVVSDELVLLEYSSLSSLQEKTVRLKQKISKMNNPFFIFSSIPKVKYYGLVY